jgi:hypothetical protein
MCQTKPPAVIQVLALPDRTIAGTVVEGNVLSALGAVAFKEESNWQYAATAVGDKGHESSVHASVNPSPVTEAASDGYAAFIDASDDEIAICRTAPSICAVAFNRATQILTAPCSFAIIQAMATPDRSRANATRGAISGVGR